MDFSPKIIKQTISSIKFEWNKMDNCEIYRVEQWIKGDKWKIVYFGSETECTVDQLEENFCYKFRLNGIHFDGEQFVTITTSELFKGCTIPDTPTCTSLHRVIKKSQENIVRRFLTVKPDLVNVTGPRGLTPLAVATINGDKSMVNILLTAGADVNIGCPSSKRTPLHLALFHGWNEIGKILIVKKANIDAIDCIGMNFGHYAIDGGHIESLRFVIENGAKVESRDSCGWTYLLRVICLEAGILFVKLLLDNNSIINVTDNNKLSCTDHAVLTNQLDIVELLQKVELKREKLKKINQKQ